MKLDLQLNLKVALDCAREFCILCVALLFLSPAVNAQDAQQQQQPLEIPGANPDAAPVKIADPLLPQAPNNQAINKKNRVAAVKPINGNVNIDGAVQILNARRNGNGGFGNMFQNRAIEESMSRAKLEIVQPSPELLKLLGEIDDPSFEIRQAASQKLLDRSFTDESIWAVLDRFTLSEEARGRLLTAACRRVLDRPRGALGIRMGQAPLDRPGVVIQATLVGMPAEKFLRAGDVIEEIDGHKVASTMDLVESIQNYSPGREVKIKLRRPERDPQGRPLIGPDGKMIERPVDLAMPLGNAEDLDKADPGDPRAAQNMQLQQRVLEAQVILKRFAAPSAPVLAPAPEVP
jgi:hypothetical protein